MDKAETGIKTVFYNKRHQVIKTNRSKVVNRAVVTCVGRMQVNQYGASVAEVYDAGTGELHAVIKLSAKGDLAIAYKRDPRDFETKYAVGYLLD